MNSIQVIAVEAALAVFAVGVLIWALRTRGAASITKALLRFFFIFAHSAIT